MEYLTVNCQCPRCWDCSQKEAYSAIQINFIPNLYSRTVGEIIEVILIWPVPIVVLAIPIYCLRASSKCFQLVREYPAESSVAGRIEMH